MAGKIKNCPMCGRLFADHGARVCADCYDKIQKKESEVINYVRDNPKCKVGDIVEATGAPERMIKKMIQDGRFIQTGAQMSYPCEKCGAPIITGRICHSCMDAMRKDLQKQTSSIVAAQQAAKGAKGHGMYSKKSLEH